MGAVLRLGRHLQPDPAGGGADPWPTEGGQPAHHRRHRRRRRQPGLRAADRGARPERYGAGVAPHDPARPLHSRSPAVSDESAKNRSQAAGLAGARSSRDLTISPEPKLSDRAYAAILTP